MVNSSKIHDDDSVETAPSSVTRVVQEHEFHWENLPLDVQERIVQDSITNISERITAEEVFHESVLPTESEGSEIEYSALAESLSKDQLQVIGENIQPHDVVSGTEEENMTTQSSLSKAVDAALLEHPAATLYAMSVVTFMCAFYFQSILIALAGAAMLILTTLHYAD
ncbi:hypothetical protein E4P24_02110 [Haloferax sp. AS1]|uniref:hypothetical protein n=1 Tax=Haloferax sp. AS1 TaxID=2562277 RepID=UPI00165F9FD2|nr:hypothetical protein [Haloferax sp. AS1]MBC9985167.1 hypothetical protein [Haloferax sp. AS1]